MCCLYPLNYNAGRGSGSGHVIEQDFACLFLKADVARITGADRCFRKRVPATGEKVTVRSIGRLVEPG